MFEELDLYFVIDMHPLDKGPGERSRALCIVL